MNSKYFGVVLLDFDREKGERFSPKSPRKYTSGVHVHHIEYLSSEAIAAETIGYKGCPVAYELVLGERHPCLAMQYINGPSLQKLISDGPLERTVASNLM